jgi:hypothetical protein
LLVVLVGVEGALGFTDNHVVWPAVTSSPSTSAGCLTSSGPPGARLTIFTGALLAIVLAAYWCAIEIARRRSKPDAQQRERTVKHLLVGLAAALLPGPAVLMFVADHCATSRRPARSSAIDAERRPSLDAALAAWMKRLCSTSDIQPCGPERSIPVYFVSTEGGGIRAAVWTAFLLDRLAQNPDFLERTFSISGVSGGAVGAAVFRACHLTAREGSEDPVRQRATRAACLRHFAETDLLSPLTSSWLFEDLLARVVPTTWCNTPGCGVLSRGAWFEQAMEDGAAGLRRGLIQSGWTGDDSDPSKPGALLPSSHVGPYLLLNATWVESGERAIASDLRVGWPTFAAVKDQLAIGGEDVPLGTAAHNAARFPFINAIGSLHAPRARCANLLPESGGRTLEPSQPRAGSAANAEMEACGHLADGGYFDNSGGQSTLDVLRGFSACLGDPNDPDAKQYTSCHSLDVAQRAWLRAHLIPQIIMIRNDVDPSLVCAAACPFTRARPVPVDITASADRSTACPDSDDGYHPDRPTCRVPSDLFVGLAGPALAAFNVLGTGSNGRLAEARQAGAVRVLRGRLGAAAASSRLPPVQPLDLTPDGVLYPLGWHLSTAAIEGMLERSAKVVQELKGDE